MCDSAHKIVYAKDLCLLLLLVTNDYSKILGSIIRSKYLCEPLKWKTPRPSTRDKALLDKEAWILALLVESGVI